MATNLPKYLINLIPVHTFTNLVKPNILYGGNFIIKKNIHVPGSYDSDRINNIYYGRMILNNNNYDAVQFECIEDLGKTPEYVSFELEIMKNNILLRENIYLDIKCDKKYYKVMMKNHRNKQTFEHTKIGFYGMPNHIVDFYDMIRKTEKE